VLKLFNAYRVLATVVGILLTILVFVAVPLKYLPDDGTSAQTFGQDLTSIVGVTHGWFYIAYLGVSLVIVRRSRWSVGFSLLVLLAGLIPILIFWVESRVVRRLRAENAELAPASPASPSTSST
jgi:integral membrane protein